MWEFKAMGLESRVQSKLRLDIPSYRELDLRSVCAVTGWKHWSHSNSRYSDKATG